MEANGICSAIRQKKPLVHCISNIVTANDCANLALAIGASPIMAQAPQEMKYITGMADAVVISTGTPDEEKFQACRLAGIKGNERHIPVILDPVGIGASPWRAQNVSDILKDMHPDIIHGNVNEIQALLNNEYEGHGVDASPTDISRQDIAVKLAKKLNCTVIISGVDDLITDGERVETVSGGSIRMRSITGAGCMLAVLCGAFAAVEKDSFKATVMAAKFWKKCAEQAEEASGIGHFHMALFDAAEAISFSEF